jgi:AraC family transcriptional regulator
LKPVKQETAIAHRTLVNQAIDWIQLELDDETSLELLADRAGVSPFYFHRVFSSVVGEAPAAYVRRLRLERAALRLKYTQRPVTEIAFDAGYQTHESFTRAFKARFGKAPRQFRDHEACSPTEAEAMFEIVRMPPRRIASLRHVGPYDEVGHAFMRVLDWAARRGIDAGERLVAVYWDHQSITPPDRARCEVGLFLDEYDQYDEARERGDDVIKVRELQGGDHAVMRCLGPTQERRRQYDLLYGHWLPERGRMPADVPPYEEYIPPGGDLERLDQVTNVHVLLAPKRAA